MVHLKIDSIDGIMFGFEIHTKYGIKLEIIEINDLYSVTGSSKRYRNKNIDASLDMEYQWDENSHYKIDGLLDGMSLGK